MNIPVLAGVVVVMVGLRFTRINMLGWMVAWWAAVYVAVRYGVSPAVPSSIVSMFMGIVTLALLTYVFSDAERLEGIKRPLIQFMVDRKYTIPLAIVVLALPVLVGANIYLESSKGVEAPLFGRTIHPAPPDAITLAGKNISLINRENPFRELEDNDPEAFGKHVENGRRVYYQNCVFCHGDNMDGNGIFAHALDPLPASFADATTIAMLQESYLFWRIAKGAPGLPQESGPWASAMPAWENFLTEEEIWEVILFLYDYTDQRPRAVEHIE